MNGRCWLMPLITVMLAFSLGHATAEQASETYKANVEAFLRCDIVGDVTLGKVASQWFGSQDVTTYGNTGYQVDTHWLTGSESTLEGEATTWSDIDGVHPAGTHDGTVYVYVDGTLAKSSSPVGNDAGLASDTAVVLYDGSSVGTIQVTLSVSF